MYAKRKISILIGGIVTAACMTGTALADAENQLKPVTDLRPALSQLGVVMQLPNAEIRENRIYTLIVRNPGDLIPTGVDDVGPGDRVMARLLPGNQLLLYTALGEQSAPIQLNEDGSIRHMELVRQTDLNQHSSAHSRHRKRQPSYQRGGDTAPPPGFGRAGNIIGR